MSTAHPGSRVKSEVSSPGDAFYVPKSQDYGTVEGLNSVSTDLASNASTAPMFDKNRRGHTFLITLILPLSFSRRRHAVKL